MKNRLLLVDDNEANQEVALYHLEKLGYSADVANNGLEAVHAHSLHPYDLILMDCQMPKMDGFQATAAIRKADGSTRHTPIIAMTANALEGDREACKASGMDDFVSKPVDVARLKDVLLHWLEGAASGASSPAPEIDTSKTQGPIDMDHLRNITDNDEVGMQRLVGIYLMETQKELDQLARAVEKKDAAEIHRISHGVKGASAAYGMVRIAEFFRDLEKQGKDNRSQESSETLKKAQTEFKEIESTWKSYLEGTARNKAA